jgi:hypothetical protein
MAAEEYLKIAELAARLKLSRKTIQNKMWAGVFIVGVHYFSPAGMGTRFKWSAIVAWMEGGDDSTAPDEESIPMARGYKLGGRQ